MRCSSVAQTSTGLSGCFAASSVTTAASFFKHLALLRRGPGRMARARLLHRPVDRLERLPAALRQDGSEPEFTRHPARYLRAGPQATIRRRLKQTSLELVQQVRPQDRGAGAVPAPQITQSLGTVGVIASPQTLHPAPRKRDRGRDLGNLVPLAQKPDRLKVPPHGHVRAGPVLLLQSQNAQVIRHMRHGSSPRLMALQPIRVPNPGKSEATPLAGVRMIRWATLLLRTAKAGSDQDRKRSVAVRLI